MGSAGSKARRNAQSTLSLESTEGGDSGKRSRGKWILRPACLGSPDSDGNEQVRRYEARKHHGDTSRNFAIVTGSRDVHRPCHKKRSKRPVKGPISDIGPHDGGDGSISSETIQRGNRSHMASSAQSSSTRIRFLSYFRSNLGSISSRLSRASSERLGPAFSFDDRDESQGGNEERLTDLEFHLPEGSHENQRTPTTGEVPLDESALRTRVEYSLCSPRTMNSNMSTEARFQDRIGVREPSEANVRFSRTLSVGRLRDRVLRRSSLSELALCPLQQGGNGGSVQTGDATMTPPTISGRSASSVSSYVYGVPDPDVETSQSREGRNYDPLEHRSNFLERRHRIRSQVRALQRLGSRFENLPGHDHSCILSGQNHMGRCNCHLGSHNSHSNNDNNARASISRIVMLAEALFEVLDEIHQQSVVLSSQPSVSPIGSVPAPSDAVNALPTRSYIKLLRQHDEEVTQCYICLVEYEEGDTIRRLPCHHEFHQNCVDKWLKEIHRVCPLCRGDICRPSVTLEGN